MRERTTFLVDMCLLHLREDAMGECWTELSPRSFAGKAMCQYAAGMAESSPTTQMAHIAPSARARVQDVPNVSTSIRSYSAVLKIQCDVVPHPNTLQSVAESRTQLAACRQVTVEDGNSLTPFCTTYGTRTVSIVFKTELGNVPSLVLDESNGVDVQIVETMRGTKLDVECSRHGHCNTELGECDCFDGWASSDGNGAMGHRMDCGWYESGSATVVPPT